MVVQSAFRSPMDDDLRDGLVSVQAEIGKVKRVLDAGPPQKHYGMEGGLLAEYLVSSFPISVVNLFQFRHSTTIA